MIENTIEYIISTNKSKFCGYQSKKGNSGTVKVFIPNIYSISVDFDDFIDWLEFFLIVERICLERAFQKIKMKNRCNPCKMDKYAHMMKDWS